MRGWIRQALTRKVTVKGAKGYAKKVEVEPSEKLVYGITFAVIALTALTAIQIAHIIVMRELNSEVNSAIMLVIGTILGVFFGKKA